MSDFETMRREAARRTLADAAGAEDADTARLLEMCADDLTRPMTEADEALIAPPGTTCGCGRPMFPGQSRCTACQCRWRP